jgi:hypothetical protein
VRFVYFSLVLFVAGIALSAEKYTGPRPPKQDVPYLLHANNLVETEIAEAKEESRKDDITYVISGAASPVKTPLAGPIFLLQAEKLIPDKMQLYRLEVKNGRREVMFSHKQKSSAKPLRLTLYRLADNLYRIEVYDSLENGEYCLTPEGSNQVFCFSEY